MSPVYAPLCDCGLRTTRAQEACNRILAGCRSELRREVFNELRTIDELLSEEPT